MKKIRVFICALVAFVLYFSVIPLPAFAQTTDEYAYIGGFPIGISIDVGGLLVESVTGVETEYGMAAVSGLRTGDIIKSIGGIKVDSVDDVPDVLSPSPTTIELLRDGRIVTVEVVPIVELYSNKPRLGVQIRDMIYGVGTVTFVREDGSFTALGHEIFGESGAHIPFEGGRIHACKIVGIKRGSKDEAGALLASVLPDKIYGTVSCNNTFGIAGRYTTEFDKTEKIPIATRDDVNPGPAKIKSCVNGKSEYYDIEIIKASKQGGRKEKGLVIRITDKRLLEMTGGVVRGMSGSPIVQNGKLVGAVTHVFLNDFTKGYGVFADCLN